MKRTLEVTWDDPMRLAQAGRSMSGIEFLRAIRDGKLPHPPICSLLSYRLVDVEPGHVVFEITAGEQQRLAFARALLYRPDWLFLDEATASLPEEDQDRLYALLKERLPGTTLVSIGHRETLARYHDERLVWRGSALVPA